MKLLILTTLVVGALAAPPAMAQPAPATCQGVRVTINGTADDDTLRGTRGRDVMLGGPGHDTIRGRGGNDLICGGDGDDDLSGGPGDDELQGGGQSGTGDVLRGGTGNDRLVPGLDRTANHHARDTVSWAAERAGMAVSVPRGRAISSAGATEHDTLLVEDSLVFILTRHNDTLVSTEKRDFVYPGAGDDRVKTKDGSDRVFFPQDEDAGDGDVVRLGGDKDWVRHYQGGLRAWGGGFGDRIEQYGVGENMLDGGPGSDRIRVLVTDVPGQRYRGAEGGRDLLQVFEENGEDVELDMATGIARRGPDDIEIVMTGFRKISFRGLGGLLTVTGTPARDMISTRKAATFAGLGGNDTFLGSRLDDTFDGGEGSDKYDQDPGRDDVNTCISVERDPRNHCAAP